MQNSIQERNAIMKQVSNELEMLFDKKNIKTLEEWGTSIKTDLRYKDA